MTRVLADQGAVAGSRDAGRARALRRARNARIRGRRRRGRRRRWWRRRGWRRWWHERIVRLDEIDPSRLVRDEDIEAVVIERDLAWDAADRNQAHGLPAAAVDHLHVAGEDEAHVEVIAVVADRQPFAPPRERDIGKRSRPELDDVHDVVDLVRDVELLAIG